MPETLDDPPSEDLPNGASHVPLSDDELELAYVAAVIGDPDGVLFSQARGLPAAAFINFEAQQIWRALASGVKTDDHAQLLATTGLTFNRLGELFQMDRMGTMSALHLAELWRRYRLRLCRHLAKRIAEADEVQADEWKKIIDGMQGDASEPSIKPMSSYLVPSPDDNSVLLGNRFLNRGDGGVLVSTAGMGKSSMCLQASYSWALGRSFFGVKPNGQLKSLILQSEDSDGDVAEVRVSMEHAMNLSADDLAKIDENVILITDRVSRGQKLILRLRRLIAKHKPDLVWLNPLIAFMDGDLTQAKDVSAFLREGLNSLNDPPTFGYIIVHHTTKPPNEKDRGDIAWNEQMYQMAGSYDLPGWARFIMVLKAVADKEGHFNLILAKRGRRAGVTKEVEGPFGSKKDEPCTTIPLKHADRMIETPSGRKMPMIFWERSDHETKPAAKPSGKPYAPTLEDILPAFRVPKDKAWTYKQAVRAVSSIRHLSASQFDTLLAEGVATGRITRIGDDTAPRYFTGS